MVGIEEARGQIAQARQQLLQAKEYLETQKQEVSKKRGEAQEAKDLLISEAKKIPVASQSALRQGLFSGLEGRKRKSIIESTKRQIGSNLSEIESFEKELSRYEEEELKPFELQISQKEAEIADYERQVAEYERHVNAINLAQRVYYGGVSPAALLGDRLAREYYNKLVEGERMLIESKLKSIQPLQPTITEKTLNMSLPPELRNLPAEKIKLGVKEITPISPSDISSINKSVSIKVKPPAQRDLSMTKLVKEWKPFQSINLDSIKRAIDLQTKQFLTAGSPIKYTRLTELTPRRGYESIAKEKNMLGVIRPKAVRMGPSLIKDKITKKSFAPIVQKSTAFQSLIKKKVNRGILTKEPSLFSRKSKKTIWRF